MNKEYSIKDVTYSTFMKQFMNGGRVISDTTPTLSIVYPKEKWADYSDQVNSTPNAVNNNYRSTDYENTSDKNNNSSEI